MTLGISMFFVARRFDSAPSSPGAAIDRASGLAIGAVRGLSQSNFELWSQPSVSAFGERDARCTISLIDIADAAKVHQAEDKAFR
jgi:hypothetical protein